MSVTTEVSQFYKKKLAFFTLVVHLQHTLGAMASGVQQSECTANGFYNQTDKVIYLNNQIIKSRTSNKAI